MGFIRSLFGSRTKVLTEKDNVGTRYDTHDRVQAFWAPFILSRPKFPYIFFDFPNRQDAMDAMLSIPPVRKASDTGQLISTEILQFGVYPLEDRAGKWGFFLAGDQISPELFDAVVVACRRHNGANERLGDRPQSAAKPATPSVGVSGVKFVREERVDMLAQMKARGIEIHDLSGCGPTASIAIKRHFNAPGKAAAMAFLRENPVDKPYYFIVVHTPEGVFGRDKDGIYEQPD